MPRVLAMPTPLLNRVRTSAVLCFLAGAWLALMTPGALPRASAHAEGAPAPASNTICPVMEDEPVDAEIFVDLGARGRVYFCCPKCRRLYNEDPDKYADALVRVMPASFQAQTPETPTQVPGGTAAPASPPAASGADPPPAIPGLNASPVPPSPEGAPQRAPTLLTRIGRLHIVGLHFPLAFIVGGAGLDLFCAFRRRVKGAAYGGASVRILAWFGAVSALVSMTLGLLLEASVEARLASIPEDLARLDWHKWLGIASASLACLALLFVELRERKRGFGSPWPATIALLLSAVVVGAAGHFGASLVWGPDFLLPSLW